MDKKCNLNKFTFMSILDNKNKSNKLENQAHGSRECFSPNIFSLVFFFFIKFGEKTFQQTRREIIWTPPIFIPLLLPTKHLLKIFPLHFYLILFLCSLFHLQPKDPCLVLVEISILPQKLLNHLFKPCTTQILA